MIISRHLEYLIDQHPEDVRKARVFAVIFKRTTIISYGYNRKRFQYCSSIRGNTFTTHAEISSLKKAGHRARGADILVLRRRKDKTFSMSKPCSKCEFQIRKAGISTMTYVDWQGMLITISL